MKILQFSKFYPPFAGGIESVALELTVGLNARGFRTDVLCAGLELETRIEDADGYTIERAGSLGKLLSTSMSPALIWRFMKMRQRYDIVHVHLPNPMANLALWLAACPSRIVVHWHSDIVNQPRALQFYAPLQEWLLRRADAIIATSATYAEHSHWLRPHLSKVKVVPLGVNPARTERELCNVRDVACKVRHTYGERPLVFALGRMTSYKGFETLIESVGLMKHDVQVVVGGSGELLMHHRRQVHLARLEHRIRFVGEMSPDEVQAHMAAADVFCLPSRTRAEAFGVVLLEAMAAELPIVASDIVGSGVSWVNRDGETGINVPVGDSAAMAHAIDSILSDPAKAQRMGAAGRHRLEAVFTADHMVENTLAVYRETCGFV